MMTNFTGKSHCQALYCERSPSHHKQYLKAIFSFPRGTGRLGIFSSWTSDRAGLVKIEKCTCKSPAFEFTPTFLHTGPVDMRAPSPHVPSNLLSPQISHLLFQFSLINSTCFNFNKSSRTTVTLGPPFCFISPSCFECHISCGIRTHTHSHTPRCQSTDVSS